MKQNPFEKNIKKNCAVCGKIILVNSSGGGECIHCGWYNNKLGEENKDRVIFPNVVSENKARLLIKEDKPLRPNLNEFMEMFYFYGEVEFWYDNKNCSLFFNHNENEYKIEFGWSPESICYFSNAEDFIKNAKIGSEYIRDIWDKVENPKYI